MPTLRILALVFAVLGPRALADHDSHAAGSSSWRVIVNPTNPATSVDRRFLADVFLKKITRWSRGDGVRPIDQRADATVRARFSEEVLGRSVASIQNYWAQLVFSGRDLPPPELDTDDEVVQFVLRNVGAVGYVSASANLGSTRALTVR
jgi:ABC-type phosphate transport system substrate-binding protein